MDNHFHLLVEEVVEGGISKFMQRVGTGYSKYYNKKYERNGSLFQGKFKATKLNGHYILQFLSVYVNLNYKHHKINPKNKIVISSYSRYVTENLKKYKPCSKGEIKKIIKSVGGVNKYKEYALKNSHYFTEQHELNIEQL